MMRVFSIVVGSLLLMQSCAHRGASEWDHQHVIVEHSIGIPLGLDPLSGVEEYWIPITSTGVVPQRDSETGAILCHDTLGIVARRFEGYTNNPSFASNVTMITRAIIMERGRELGGISDWIVGQPGLGPFGGDSIIYHNVQLRALSDAELAETIAMIGDEPSVGILAAPTVAVLSVPRICTVSREKVSRGESAIPISTPKQGPDE